MLNDSDLAPALLDMLETTVNEAYERGFVITKVYTPHFAILARHFSNKMRHTFAEHQHTYNPLSMQYYTHCGIVTIAPMHTLHESGTIEQDGLVFPEQAYLDYLAEKAFFPESHEKDDRD